MQTVLDIVLIVAGILWSLVFLAILVAVLAVLWLARRYLSAADRYLRTDAAAFLGGIQQQVDVVTAQTSRFAGRTSPRVAPRTRLAAPRPAFSLPFLRRRRPWWRRLLGN